MLRVIVRRGRSDFAMLVADMPVSRRLRDDGAIYPAEKHRRGRESLEGKCGHDEPCEEEADSGH